MKIIALKGKNGSGKSTVAAMLSKKLDEKGISNKVLSFAEPLKKMATMFNGVKDWENRILKDRERPLLEHIANAVKSSFSFNPFADQLLLNIANHQLDTKVIIVSDLRFYDEYEELCNWCDGDTIYKMVIVEIKNKLTDNNPPEYDLDKIPSDIILNFDGDLELSIEKLLVEILKD